MTTSVVSGAVPFCREVALDPEPHLVGSECSRCQARYFDRRNGCARCGGTDFVGFQPPPHGTVETYTVVHRSLPGVEVPYVAVIVAVDGGGMLNGVLRSVDPSEVEAFVGMRVRVVFVPLARRGDDVAIGYVFEPDGVA